MFYNDDMKKIGQDMQYYVASLAGDQEQTRINLRARQVRDRYKHVIQAVYGCSAPLFLQHTNNVYIMMKNDIKTLIVYVDESIFAAELNAQRELIKLMLLEQFGEEVEEFSIFVSRGKYKQNYPFVDENVSETHLPFKSEPLDENEQAFVKKTAETVQGLGLKKSFEKAMTASLELNKTEKGKYHMISLVYRILKIN